MGRTQSSGPDEGPLGEQTDIEAATPAQVADTDADLADEAAYTEVETDPLGGTGGVSSGGVG